MSKVPTSDNASEIESFYAKRCERLLKRWQGVRNTSTVRKKRDTTHRQNTNVSELTTHLNYIEEAPKKTPIHSHCDVLVVGGGPSGLAAALASKRAGADTILLERFGCFGGVITTVGMETLGWYRYEGCIDSEGIGIEMERRAADMGATTKWPYNDSECLDADFFKVVADNLILESGVKPLLHAIAVDAIMDGNTIKGVIIESKSGRQAILASRVIDCTGDADIAYLAGAEYTQNTKDEMMGITTVFGTSGVERERFLEYASNNQKTYQDWSRTWQQKTDGKEDHLPSPYLEEEFDRARENNIIPEDTQNLGGSWSSITHAGEATNLNLVHMYGVSGTDVDDLTKASIEGRKQTMHALKALKHTLPGFEKAKLRTFGMTLGVRDTRKIVGRYNLTEEDVRGEARFKDSIGIFPEFLDGYNVLVLPTTGRYFQVPYGCLLPTKIENLLVAGRCVAGDKISHSAMRNMMACTVTGQGAGVAAAVSLRRNETTHKLDISSLQAELVEQHVRIA